VLEGILKAILIEAIFCQTWDFKLLYLVHTLASLLDTSFFRQSFLRKFFVLVVAYLTACIS
jgi:hypothetical protein